MARVIYGLNINQFLSEIPNKTEAIRNLGLDIRDLDVIRDIGSSPISLQKDDLKLISGLKSDIRSVLFSLRSSTSFFPTVLANAPVTDFPINTNIIINNQLSASSYKYNYYDFSSNEVKTADISTSRNSSWSSFESSPTAPIFYGGDLEIAPSSATNQSLLSATELEIKTTPEKLEFASQVPTHLIKIKINGEDYSFYAMKGIPLEFNGFFRTARFTANFTGTTSATLVLEYLDTNQIFTRQVTRGSSIDLIDFKTRLKRLKFYYNPANITALRLPNMFISNWPNVVMPALRRIDLNVNDFREMPNFERLAPILNELDISGNDLTRASTTPANTQLQRLPAGMTILRINGCFSDNTPVDLSKFENLQIFNFDSSYTVSTNNTVSGKRMTDNGSTPAVYVNSEDKNLSLREYRVNNQPYRTLHTSVTKAENLEIFNLSNMNIISDSNGNPITLASQKLKNFASSGSHNLINVSGREDLTNYQHSYGYTLTGNSEVGSTFNQCRKLETISLYSTYVTGNIGTAFAELPALKSLDLRLTRIGGNVDNNTFRGSNALTTLLIQGTNLGAGSSARTFSNDCFDSLSNLESIQIIGNRNIKGPLPNFINNKKMRVINIQGTNFDSNLQTYNSLPLLNTLIVRSCLISGSVPKFENNILETIRLEFNNLTSSTENRFPEFNCSRLKYFSINNNNLAGPLSSFKNCPNLETLIVSGNNFAGYPEGSLELCTKLKIIDFSNCRFNVQDIELITSDLRKNVNSNKRSGVRVNLLGNNYNTANFSELLLSNINYLRNQGWSVTI